MPSTPGSKTFFSITGGNTGIMIHTGHAVLNGFIATNEGAVVIYLKFYDKATAGASAETPILQVLVPIDESVVLGGIGQSYQLGLSFRAVAQAALIGVTGAASDTFTLTALFN